MSILTAQASFADLTLRVVGPDGILKNMKTVKLGSPSVIEIKDKPTYLMVRKTGSNSGYILSFAREKNAKQVASDLKNGEDYNLVIQYERDVTLGDTYFVIIAVDNDDNTIQDFM